MGACACAGGGWRSGFVAVPTAFGTHRYGARESVWVVGCQIPSERSVCQKRGREKERKYIFRLAKTI